MVGALETPNRTVIVGDHPATEADHPRGDEVGAAAVVGARADVAVVEIGDKAA